MERFSGFSRGQVPNPQSAVVGAGDHVVTIGADCYGVDPVDMPLERPSDFSSKLAASYPGGRGPRSDLPQSGSLTNP
jgi:hypothetical protein